MIEQKINALNQAAPLQGWDLPEAFATLRRLMEARMSYPDIVTFAGGVPVFVTESEDRQFKPSAQEFVDAVTARTRWIILNSPCNPTGAVYSSAELAEIARMLERHPDVLVLSDDIYEHLIYQDEAFATIASVCPSLKDRTLTVNGVSKAFCMTGWRIGFAGGPSWMIRAMAKLQGQTTNNPTSISQAAAAAALDGPTDFITDHRKCYRERRDLAVRMLNDTPGLKVQASAGAFYLYVSIRELIGKRTATDRTIESDIDFARYLLDEALVAVVPGAGFGLSPYVRLAYPVGDDVLREGCRRIQAACAALQ